tara:strand:- start:156 stop:377 length:222 start_codon:yes stop_codon:yes gene_type:complete
MEFHKASDLYLLDIEEEVSSDDETNCVASIAELLDERTILEERMIRNYQNNQNDTSIHIRLGEIEEELRILGW